MIEIFGEFMMEYMISLMTGMFDRNLLRIFLFVHSTCQFLRIRRCQLMLLLQNRMENPVMIMGHEDLELQLNIKRYNFKDLDSLVPRLYQTTVYNRGPTRNQKYI